MTLNLPRMDMNLEGIDLMASVVGMLHYMHTVNLTVMHSAFSVFTHAGISFGIALMTGVASHISKYLMSYIIKKIKSKLK